MKWFSLVLILYSFSSWGQRDTITDCNQPRRNGYWTIIGSMKDLPDYCDTCIIEEGNFNRSRKTGLWTRYYPNGKKKSQINYYHGKSIGPFVTYYENGNPEEIGEWLCTKYNGFVRFYESGELQYKNIDHRFASYHFQNEDSILIEFDILSCIDSNDMFNRSHFDSLVNSFGFKNIQLDPPIPLSTASYEVVHTNSGVWGEEMTIVNRYISDDSKYYNIAADNDITCSCKNEKWKCYDQHDRMILKGKFKNSIFDNGYLYLYDEENKLFLREKYKNGQQTK